MKNPNPIHRVPAVAFETLHENEIPEEDVEDGCRLTVDSTDAELSILGYNSHVKLRVKGHEQTIDIGIEARTVEVKTRNGFSIFTLY